MANKRHPLKVYIGALLWRFRHKRYTLHIGKHTYGRPQIISFAGDNGTITIGKYCSIARKVKIFAGGNHRIDWVSTYPFRIVFNFPGKYEDGNPKSNGPVKIGNDVWLAHGSTIMSGTTVGDGAVVATNALVFKDVPPYAIVGGNPAEVIEYRFAEREIAALLAIRWWDWEEEKVLANSNYSAYFKSIRVSTP